MKRRIQAEAHEGHVHAAYILLRPARKGCVARTVESPDHLIMVDLDKRGRLVGIEILDPADLAAELAAATKKAVRREAKKRRRR